MMTAKHRPPDPILLASDTGRRVNGSGATLRGALLTLALILTACGTQDPGVSLNHTDDRTTAATTSDADPTASTPPQPTEAERETSAPDPALAECAEQAQDILDEQGNDGEARRSADEARAACEAEITQNPTETATPTPNGQAECLQDGDRRDAPPVDDERLVAVYFSCSPERGLIEPIVYRLDREIDDSKISAEARARAAFDA